MAESKATQSYPKMSDKRIAPSAKPRTPATRSEKKREENSPLDQPEDQQKTIRHTSGDSTVGDFFTTQTDDTEIEETSQVHILSYPMNPSDITLIAREFRSLMSADIRSEIKAAVDSSAGDFFTTQTDDTEIEETSQVHILLYHMNPSDITLIAREFRSLMSADIRSEIKDAVQEAVLEVT